MPKKKSTASAATKRKQKEDDHIKSIKDKFSSSVYLVIENVFSEDDGTHLRVVSPGMISKKDAIDILFANLERCIQHTIANIFGEIIDYDDFDEEDSNNISTIGENVNRKGNEFSFSGLLSEKDKYTPSKWYTLDFKKMIKTHMDKTYPEFHRIDDSGFTDYFNNIENESDSNVLRVVFENIEPKMVGYIRLFFIEIPLGIIYNDVLFNAQALVVPQFSKKPLAKHIKKVGFSMYLS